MSFEIYVGNYPIEFSREDLANLFQEFHGIRIQRFIQKDKKCYSFVSCIDIDQVLSIIEKKNGSLASGRKIVVRACDKDLQSYVDLLLQEKSNKTGSNNDSSPVPLKGENCEILHTKTNDNNDGHQETNSLDSFHMLNRSNVNKDNFDDLGKSSGIENNIPETCVESTEFNKFGVVLDTSLIPVKMKKNVIFNRKRYEDHQFQKNGCGFGSLNHNSGDKYLSMPGNSSKIDIHQPNVYSTELNEYKQVSHTKMDVPYAASSELNKYKENSSTSLFPINVIGNMTPLQRNYDYNNQFQENLYDSHELDYQDANKYNSPSAHCNSKIDISPPNASHAAVNYDKIPVIHPLIPSQITNIISDENSSAVLDDNQLQISSHDSLYHPSPTFYCPSSVDDCDLSSMVYDSKLSLHSKIGQMVKLDSAPTATVSMQETSKQLSWVSVTNFPLYTEVGTIGELFSDYNPIHIRMICNGPRKDKLLTEAHISFCNSDVADDVIMNFDNTFFQGRIILVNDLDDLTVMKELLEVSQS